MPTVRDRIAQCACLNILLPRLDPHLEDCSYAYRPGRSIFQAIEQIEVWRDQGHGYLLESDIEECFDSIDRELLSENLQQFVPDRRLLEVIRLWMEASVIWERKGTRTQGTSAKPSTLEDSLTPLLPSSGNLLGGVSPQDYPDPDAVQYADVVQLQPCGIPQGSVLSPLLCNLFLDRFYEILLRRRFKLVRYADDFVIVATRRERVEDALDEVRLALGNIGLRVNAGKTRITTFEQGFRYLGTIFQGELTLGTVERILPNGSLQYSAGYPAAPSRAAAEEWGPPPPKATGFAAITSTLAQQPQTQTTSLSGALQKAIAKQQHKNRSHFRRAAATPLESSYLV